MRIEPDLKLDFNNVLIRPKRSTLSSRKQVDLYRKLTFRNSKQQYTGVPIIAANMDHTGTFEMAKSLWNSNSLSTAVHKHYPADDLIAFFKDFTNIPVFYSLGIGSSDLEKYQRVQQKTSIQYICIDVANGYSEHFVDFVKRFREDNPNVTVMAGNVVTGDMVEELILAGADIIKAGIGPGCQVADTRILMSNGTYKNIVDVAPGDRIITMTGKPATVKKSFTTGFRKVRKIQNTYFYKPLTQTSDHKCFVGELSTVNKQTLQSGEYQKSLECPTKTKWKESKDLELCVGLMPNKIQWELPQTFEYDISEFFSQKIKSDYNLGYMFGFFLGDGTSRKVKDTTEVEFQHQDRVNKLCNAIENVVGKSPSVEWSNNPKSYTKITLHGKHWEELFQSFGKFNEKTLPEKYMCLNKQYIQGLFDGLIDSNGHISNKGQTNFNNTSPRLMELFGWITYELFGSFPNLFEHPRHDGYGGFLASTHEKQQANDYQGIKILDVSDEQEIEVPVYDLEIEDQTHSFIANNMIVHNSVCTTRKITGVGYPQLSAIIECADAAHGLGGHLCSDGGCVNPGDVAKAFGAGADFVMLGNMFAGHYECAGELLRITPNFNEEEEIIPSHMKFYGMSSKTAMEKYNNGVAEYRASEGKEVLVPYKGNIVTTVNEILGGLRSACTYTGSKSLKELPKRTTFLRVSQTHNTVFNNE